jgi:hypothetical protein
LSRTSRTSFTMTAPRIRSACCRLLAKDRTPLPLPRPIRRAAFPVQDFCPRDCPCNWPTLPVCSRHHNKAQGWRPYRACERRIVTRRWVVNRQAAFHCPRSNKSVGRDLLLRTTGRFGKLVLN